MRLSRTIDNDAEWDLFSKAVRPVFKHGNFILGPEVEMLEQEMARWLQTQYAIGCNSGFGAHLLGILAFDLEPRAQIAVPVLAPSDFIGVLCRHRFRPVLVDVNTYDFQMDTSDLIRRVDGNTAAIIVHHLFGGSVCMKAVMDVIDTIPVIEVLTHSLGAHIGERYAGTFGTIATADLRTTIGSGAAGDAGMLWTNNRSLAEKIRNIRHENSMAEMHMGIVSGNFQQHTIQAAFLLRKFEDWKELARRQSEQITAFAQVMRDRRVFDIVIPEFYNHYGTYLVILAEHRHKLMTYLQKRDIESSVWWPQPIHLQPGFQSLGYKRGDFPKAEYVTERLVELPVPGNEEELERLVNSIASFYGK